MAYTLPHLTTPPSAPAKTVYLVANGDLRLSANRVCWPAQEAMEAKLSQVLQQQGYQLQRAHAYDPEVQHGFISSQRMGMEIFRTIPPDAPLIVAESVWQYSHHLLAGLRDHQGAILTLANWSGQWPGLVGMLNLNGSLTKMGKAYSTLWSEAFDDAFFLQGLQTWLQQGQLQHDTSHVHRLEPARLPAAEAALGRALAQQLQQDKAILGIFDEGCMGMYNAIIDDEMLNACGIYKERLSQSALVARMRSVAESEAQAAYQWLQQQGMRFVLGQDEASELTERQVLEQLTMYIAALRIADDFGCDAIGIQYQQGLKDMTPASDLVEGLLNNVARPPVTNDDGSRLLYENQALPHFNEVDEGAAVDALVTNRVWNAMGLAPENTLHDLRWGEWYQDDSLDAFVWVFLISGAAPPAHFVDGYAGASSERQPPMYFPLGGGTLKGISKPGEIVWSRVFVMDNALHADIGRATVVALPPAETERRWQATTPQWPIMHAVLHGISRDQMMARHQANHLQVAYAPSAAQADQALAAKAAMLEAMGITVHLCGDVAVA